MTANWAEVIYDINYGLGGGILPPNTQATYTVNQQVDLATPTRKGYTFEGWHTDKHCESDVVNAIPQGSTDTQIFYAKWQANSYNVSFDYNGGKANDLPRAITATFDALIRTPLPSRTGYIFSGWQCYLEEYDPITSETTLIAKTFSEGEFDIKYIYAHDIVMTAVWTAKTYTVTLNSGANGQPSTTFEVQYDSQYTLPTPAGLKGNKFIGWYNTAGLGGKLTSDNGVSLEPWQYIIDKELYAAWDKISYTVQFVNEYNGYTEQIKCTYGTAYNFVEVKADSRTGYIFKGWSDRSCAECMAFAGIWSMRKCNTCRLYGSNEQLINPTDSEENLVYYAQWEAITYNVKYDANGGKGNMRDDKFTYDATEKLQDNTFERLGNKFVGWCNNSEGRGKIYSADTEAINLSSGQNDVVIMYAIWQEISYTIKYDTNKGNDSESGQIILNIDGQTFARMMMPKLNKEYRRNGIQLV